MSNRQENAWRPEVCPLCGSRKARHVLPGVESLLHFLTVFGGGEKLASGADVWRDRLIGGKEALSVPG